jgi:hypothetical protein
VRGQLEKISDENMKTGFPEFGDPQNLFRFG